MINVQKAKPGDAEQIQKVLYKTWLDTYPNKEFGITVEDIEERFRNRISKKGVEDVRDRIRNMDKNSSFLVAKENELVVGVCKIRRGEDSNQLGAIYVLPTYQCKGIGYMLWEESFKFFDIRSDIKVEVATYNEKAISFYEKLGFIDTGKRITDDNFNFPSGNTIPEMEMIFKRK